MIIPLPDPIRIAGLRYWQKGQIRSWIAAIAGTPEPAPRPDDEELLTARQLRAQFGGCSDMWLWRRSHPGLERLLQELAAAPNRAAAEQIIRDRLPELTAADQEIAAPKIRDILAEKPEAAA